MSQEMVLAVWRLEAGSTVREKSGDTRDHRGSMHFSPTSPLVVFELLLNPTSRIVFLRACLLHGRCSDIS